MADGGRDAQGDAEGKERPSKPKAKRGGSGRKQTGTATPSKQSEREPEIAPNLRELLELCARVLPQGSYSANSSGSNALPLREISEAYREHLRQKDVTPTDALPLPANMMRMMAPGQAGNRPLAGCRHKTCFFVGPAPELAAIEHVLRESVGTEIAAFTCNISANLGVPGLWLVRGSASGRPSDCATGVPRVIQPTCKASRPPSVRLDTRLRRGISALCPRPTVRRKPHVACVRNRIQPLRHGSPARDPTYLQSLPAPAGAIGHSLAPGPIGIMSPAHREAHRAAVTAHGGKEYPSETG